VNDVIVFEGGRILTASRGGQMDFTVIDSSPKFFLVSSNQQGAQGPPGPDVDLAYLDTIYALKSDGGTAGLSTHVQSLTPHPTYDDTPDLTLLFQNGIV
jgi:hypothetical protein